MVTGVLYVDDMTKSAPDYSNPFRGGPEDDYYWNEIDKLKVDLKCDQEQAIKFVNDLANMKGHAVTEKEIREAVYDYLEEKKLDKANDYDTLVKDYFDSNEDTDVAKKTGIRYKVSSGEFHIYPDDKLFTISLRDLLTDAGLKSSPWPQTKRQETGEKDLGEAWPKLSMISTETGKDATFFLAESTNGHLFFKPSKGTVLHKKLGGWVIEVER